MEAALTLVADDSCPAIGAVAAAPPQITRSAVGAVVAGQTAVAAKRVIQTHWERQKDQHQQRA